MRSKFWLISLCAFLGLNISGSPVLAQSQPEILSQKIQTIKQAENRNTGGLALGLLKVDTIDGASQIELTQPGIRTRLEYINKDLKVFAELPDDGEFELDSEKSIDAIQERLRVNDIEIISIDNQIVLRQGITGVTMGRTIKLDMAGNLVTAVDEKGARLLQFLPGEVASGVLAVEILDDLSRPSWQFSAQNERIMQLLSLELAGDDLVYKVKGYTHQSIFGVIPVTIEKTVNVSATTGELVGTQQSWSSRFLDLVAN